MPIRKATELSFFLWNTTPDEELLEAAQHRGDPYAGGPEEAGRSADRLAAARRWRRAPSSPTCSAFRDFESVSKDPSFFPRYTLTVKDEAQEQTLRTIVDHI